jgi:DNA replicative helicase MCM subunit Mcm2 (Cdc46/Mcm family)
MQRRLAPLGQPDQRSRSKHSLAAAQVYAELRRESAISHGMPIAVRHLESMIRMAEAHAAMHLREYVNDDDIDTAIRCALCRSRELHIHEVAGEQSWLQSSRTLQHSKPHWLASAMHC